MEGNIDVRAGGQVLFLIARSGLNIAIEHMLIGRRFDYKKSYVAIEMAALAARLLEDDLSVDALAIAYVLLRGRHVRAACGHSQEFDEVHLLDRLRPIVPQLPESALVERLRLGIDELVGKRILEVTPAAPWCWYFKFLPQNIEDGCVISVQPMPHAVEALVTHKVPERATQIVVHILEMMQAATGKGPVLALPGRWFHEKLAGILHLRLNPYRIDKRFDVELALLGRRGIVHVVLWTRDKSAEGQGSEGEHGGGAA